MKNILLEAERIYLPYVLKTVRVDTENPIDSWEEHIAPFKRRMDFLNSQTLLNNKYPKLINKKLGALKYLI